MFNKLYKADGTHIDIIPANLEEGFTLEECQKMVGGYIETFKCRDAFQIAICDEEGHLKNKPYNRVTSVVSGTHVCGDVMIIEEKYFK